jgi:hypothetical protein
MTFSSKEVCALTGVNYRRLDHWARSHIEGQKSFAGGPGSRRSWSWDDIVRVVEIRDAYKHAIETLERVGLDSAALFLRGNAGR